MKKFLLFLFLSVLVTANASQNEGFKETTEIKKLSIIEALKLNDNTNVTIEGNITKRLSNDKYTFKDSTGTITVEIDNDKWAGLSAETKDKLELTGEIEKKNSNIYLDVENIKKIDIKKPSKK